MKDGAKYKVGERVISIENPETSAVITDIKDGQYYYTEYSNGRHYPKVYFWGIEPFERNVRRLTKLERALK